MSKYTVSHSCGHDETRQIVGPVKDRDRKAAWFATGLCSSCYKAAQAKLREQAAAELVSLRVTAVASLKAAIAKMSEPRPGMTESHRAIADLAVEILGDRLAAINSSTAETLGCWQTVQTAARDAVQSAEYRIQSAKV